MCGSLGEIVYAFAINTKCVSITGTSQLKDKCEDIRLQFLTTISKKTSTVVSDIISSYQKKIWWQITMDLVLSNYCSACKAAKQLINH